MRDHASDGLVEDATGGTEMEGTTSGGVVTSDLSEVGMVLDCETSRLVLCSDPTGQISFDCVVDIRLARKNSPEMLRASVRTTTIFWPLRSCFATVLARRPSKCPLPSMTTWKHHLMSVRGISQGAIDGVGMRSM